MKLTKKSIFTFVYWLTSCLVMIIFDIVSVVQDRNPPDDIFVPGSGIDLFFILVTFGLQILFHIVLFACLRYWFFSKNKSFVGVLFMFLLSAFAVVALLMWYCFV